jgi:glucose/arabinose dehydrogenase
MRTSILCVAFSSLAALLSACAQKASMDAIEQSGSQPTLPEPKNFLLPPMQLPSHAEWPSGQTPKVPAGLRIDRIAGELAHPRQLLVLPNGDVLVAEANSPGTEALTAPKQLLESLFTDKSGKSAKGGNRITLLRKGSAHGALWEKHVFIDKLHSPFGMQVIGNYLYVADTDAVLRYPYTLGQTQITAPSEEFADLPNTINHHWTKSLVASSDGTKLYVGVGSNSNVGENGLEVEYRRAVVLQIDVASRGSRVFASGIRNPTGLQWEPQTNVLWAVANERDELGPDLVPDYLTSVRDGAFYGWPYSYYGQHVDARVPASAQRPDLVARAVAPDFALGSHVAALGLWFAQGKGLTEQYRSGAFVAEHGSWDRSPLSGYGVVFVPFRDGKPFGPPQSVVSGFYSDDQTTLYGAPVGLAQDQEGALLVADDVGNSVWRISAGP